MCYASLVLSYFAEATPPAPFRVDCLTSYSPYSVVDVPYRLPSVITRALVVPTLAVGTTSVSILCSGAFRSCYGVVKEHTAIERYNQDWSVT